RVDLDWGVVTGAKSYNIYRGPKFNGSYEIIGSSVSTTYSDTTVSNHEVWFYSITAIDSQYVIPESQLCVPQVAFVHAMPRLTRADARSRSSVLVHTSQVLRTNLLSGGALIVDDAITPTSAAVAGD